MPRLALELGSTTPAAHRQPGSLLFADVSGFTAMSERLAGQGRVGAEEVTNVISSTFAALLELSWGLGGGLLKFGGDALLLAFTGDQHETRAVTAALGMRSALRQVGAIQTSAGQVRLRLSTGVASGDLVFLIVGTSAAEMVVCGPVVNEVLAAESAAGPGQILMGVSTAAALPARCRGEVLGPGFLVARSPASAAALKPVPAVEGVDPASFVPSALRSHLLAGGGESEHRQAAVAFIHVDGFDEVLARGSDTELAERLHEVVDRGQAFCDERDVCLLASDVAPMGAKLILTAGVPAAHGHDEDRLIGAVRDIVSVDSGLPLRAGIHCGAVFSGLVGPPFRRTYTVMGDAVNTAARVAYRALPGQTLVTPQVLDRSDSRFKLSWIEPFAAKGKSGLLQAASLGEHQGRYDSAGVDLPLIGRGDEVEALIARLRGAAEGTGASVAVVGPAGSGVTRVLREAAAMVPQLPWVASTASAAERMQPFAAVRPILRSLFDLDGGASEEELSSAVKRLDRESAAWSPLLAPILGVEMDENAATIELDGRARVAQQRSTLTRLVRAAVTSPLALVLEHWDEADDASASLIELIATALTDRPAIVATTGASAPGWESHQIELKPITIQQATDLALEAGGWRVQAHQARVVAERAEGNPLVVVHMAKQVGAGADLDSLPDTVERLATARIDALSPRLRSRLRAISVLGGSFPLVDVGVLLPDEDSPLEGLNGLIEVERDRARFTSSVVHAAAYEGLPRSQRRTLHAQMAQALSGSGDRIESLAIHASEGRLDELAWQAGFAAAARAKQAAAYTEAASYLRRALSAAAQWGQAQPAEVGRAWQELCLALWAAGDMAAAETAGTKAFRLLDPASEPSGQLSLQMGLIAGEQGRSLSALRRFRAGLRRLDSAKGAWADRSRVRLLLGEASVRVQIGQLDLATEVGDRALELAESVSDEVGAAHAHNYLTQSLHLQRDPRCIDHAEKALAGFAAAGDVRTQGSALTNLGLALDSFGRLDEAIGYYERARTLFEAGAFDLPAAIVANNLAVLLAKQGRWGEAEESFLRAARVLGAAGSAYQHFAWLGFARVQVKRGALSEAETVLGNTGPELARLKLLEDEVVLAQAELALARGETATADELLASELRDEAAARSRLRGVIAARGGKVDQAADLIEQAAAAAARAHDPHEELLALENLRRLGRLEMSAVDRLKEQMGVVAWPEPLMIPPN